MLIIPDFILYLSSACPQNPYRCFFLNIVTVSLFFFLKKQETDIDNIHQLVVGATENIKEGNEDIREVMSKLCFSIHFFLLNFSFAQVLL